MSVDLPLLGLLAAVVADPAGTVALARRTRAQRTTTRARLRQLMRLGLVTHDPASHRWVATAEGEKLVARWTSPTA